MRGSFLPEGTSRGDARSKAFICVILDETGSKSRAMRLKQKGTEVTEILQWKKTIIG